MGQFTRGYIPLNPIKPPFSYGFPMVMLNYQRVSLHFPRHSSQGQLGVLHGPTDAQVATGLVPHAEGPEPFSRHAAIGPDAGPLCALVGEDAEPCPLFEEVNSFNHGFLQRHFTLGITILAKKPTKTYLNNG